MNSKQCQVGVGDSPVVPTAKRLRYPAADKAAADKAQPQPLVTLKGHTGYVNSVDWSPDGKRLGTGSVDQTAKVWDAASGMELVTLKGHTGSVGSVAWSPNGGQLAGDGRVWDATSGQRLRYVKGLISQSVAWSPTASGWQRGTPTVRRRCGTRPVGSHNYPFLLRLDCSGSNRATRGVGLDAIELLVIVAISVFNASALAIFSVKWFKLKMVRDAIWW